MGMWEDFLKSANELTEKLMEKPKYRVQFELLVKYRERHDCSMVEAEEACKFLKAYRNPDLGGETIEDILDRHDNERELEAARQEAQRSREEDEERKREALKENPTRTEQWRPIPGFGDRYIASSFGNIAHVLTIDEDDPSNPIAYFLNPSQSTKGYLSVTLYTEPFPRSAKRKRAQRPKPKTHRVHRLIAETWLESPPFSGAQVRHLDGDRENNRLDNLAWGTPEENRADQIIHGTSNMKLTKEDVYAIRRSKKSQRELAVEYGVSKSTIGRVKRGETWKPKR